MKKQTGPKAPPAGPGLGGVPQKALSPDGPGLEGLPRKVLPTAGPGLEELPLKALPLETPSLEELVQTAYYHAFCEFYSGEELDKLLETLKEDLYHVIASSFLAGYRTAGGSIPAHP